MEIVASIDFEQYKAVLVALRAPGTGTMRTAKGRYLALGISMLITVSFLLAYSAHNNLQHAALAIVLVVVAYVSCMALRGWSKSRYDACLKKIYEDQKKQLCGQPMSITQDGISGKSADLTSSYEYQWASFIRLIDLPDGLLFVPSPVSFVRIPKAMLTTDDISQIMAWWAPHSERAALILPGGRVTR